MEVVIHKSVMQFRMYYCFSSLCCEWLLFEIFVYMLNVGYKTYYAIRFFLNYNSSDSSRYLPQYIPVRDSPSVLKLIDRIVWNHKSLDSYIILLTYSISMCNTSIAKGYPLKWFYTSHRLSIIIAIRLHEVSCMIMWPIPTS